MFSHEYTHKKKEFNKEETRMLGCGFTRRSQPNFGISRLPRPKMTFSDRRDQNLVFPDFADRGSVRDQRERNKVNPDRPDQKNVKIDQRDRRQFSRGGRKMSRGGQKIISGGRKISRSSQKSSRGRSKY